MSAPVSRLGFHYFPDDSHYTERDLEEWLPTLLRLSANWLVLHATPGRPIPEPFIRGLIEAGIRPVVWIKARVDEVALDQLSPALTTYGEWGVREIVVFDRPNIRSSWSSNEWARPGLVERFVDRMLPILQLERASGMHPVFPPLEPGGDYWDTAFLETALRSMLRRGHRSLIDDLHLAIYARTFGKPLEWGYGGPAEWAASRPYNTPDGSQDQIGFRTFDWYAATTESVVGKTLPMIVVAGGPPSTLEDGDSEIASVLRAVQSGQLPQSVLGFNFYLLSANPNSPDVDSAWFDSPAQPRSVVGSAKRLLDVGGFSDSSRANGKTLNHFVLLPDSPMSEDTWAAVKTLVRDGVIGFSPEEALQADRVTILGDEASVPPSVERRLVEGGCQVTRVKGPGEMFVAAWKATYGDGK
ncbi:MAG: hypothetical protein ACE5M4_10570 [Anaerolineales bacterium]